jgi:hypothetical protein
MSINTYEPLTDQEIQDAKADAEAAFKIDQALKAAIAAECVSTWAVSHWAYECKQANVWLYLQDEDVSNRDAKKAWLGQPEIGLSESWFNALCQVWQDLVLRHELQENDLEGVGPTKAAYIVPRVNRAEVLVGDGLADARELSTSDLRKKYLPPPKPKKEIPDVRYDEPEPGQNDTSTNSGQLEPEAGDDEPVPADELEVETYELPDWVTPGALVGASEELAEALAEDALTPRVGRRACQVLHELVKERLASMNLTGGLTT